MTFPCIPVHPMRRNKKNVIGLMLSLTRVLLVASNDSAHRWRPLRGSRIAEGCRGAAIRWSAWLGRLMAVRFVASPALQKRTQCLRLLTQFSTFDVPNGKNRRKLLIQLR